MRLHDFLDYHARERGEAEFATQGHRRLTYREALAVTHRLAHAFMSAGLQRGDRIAVLSKNSIEFVLLYFAASKVGVVPVPLNYRLVPGEWRYIVHDAGAKLFLVEEGFLDAVDTIRSALPTVERFVALGEGRTAGWEDYHQWVSAQPTTPPAQEITADQALYQLYTSGTTGHPKGAVLTQRAVTTHLMQVGVACPIQPGEVVRALREERIGVATLVPAMIQACLTAVPDVAHHRYPHLRVMHYGASAMAEQTLRRAMDVFHCDFLQGYGMTETTLVMTALSPSDHRRALAEKPSLLLSAGRAVLGTEVRIVDAHDRPVPHGTLGEIVARGPQLMQGYWNQPETTAEALRGGWMHTGDAGVMDEEGYLYIHDRIKDMIVSGGENVYPRVVEEVLFQHPAIADAAVIGVPDDRWGEAVKALVVVRQGMAISAEELIGFCRAKLGGFERPRSVDFVDALPRTPSGKVLKRVLREPYWAGHERRVGGA